jgi:hypothetical protein
MSFFILWEQPSFFLFSGRGEIFFDLSSNLVLVLWSSRIENDEYDEARMYKKFGMKSTGSTRTLCVLFAEQDFRRAG